MQALLPQNAIPMTQSNAHKKAALERLNPQNQLDSTRKLQI